MSFNFLVSTHLRSGEFFSVIVLKNTGKKNDTVTSHLVNERLSLCLPVDIGAHLDQALGHRRISIHAGFFQHAVV